MTQEKIGKIVFYSRQTINYTIKSYNENGFQEVFLERNYDSQVFTPEVKQDLKDIWLPNPFLKAKEVIIKLKNLHPELEEKQLSSNNLYYHLDHTVSFKEIRKVLLKEFKVNNKGELAIESQNVIESLMSLLDLPDKETKLKRLSKIIEINNLEKIKVKIKEKKNKVIKYVNNLSNQSIESLHLNFLLVFFYFQTNCSIRTAADYFELSTAKVIRTIQKLGELETELCRELGLINKDITIIGIDEKWIKIKHSKNKWSYLFIAVDALSGDLIYTDVFESRNELTTEIFLQGLKMRGYRPEFIVTDLLELYTTLIPKVFGKRVKHIHCLLHFDLNLMKHFKDVYGNKFKKESPEAYKLYQKMKKIFRCKSPKTARKRYWGIMQLKENYLEAEKIFSYLEKHFRHLMYPLEYEGVPRTNNVTERAIKRFARQIKNCAGFENIESARLYFKAFQMVYRLTPFRKDNKNKMIRGKTPVEVSFEISTMRNKKCQIKDSA